ncbi:hypothetical protein ACIQXD_33465 [Streptomyces uncialis]|uniref:hypothetical protein n=1 Tax=Streptomyces uncialis TaxID=1048205 RepID=UPI0038005684
MRTTARIEAFDVFTGKKYEAIVPTEHTMEVPTVTQAEFQLAGIDEDGIVSLSDAAGNTRDDFLLPSGPVGESIRSRFGQGETLVLTVVSALGTERIVAAK